MANPFGSYPTSGSWLSSVTVHADVLGLGVDLCSTLLQSQCKLLSCVEAPIYTHLCSVLHWEELRDYSFF